jgi:hypothetical protein
MLPVIAVPAEYRLGHVALLTRWSRVASSPKEVIARR